MKQEEEYGPFAALGFMLLILGMLIGLAVGLSACATEQPLLTRADSVFVASGLPAPRKIKAGTVIFQAPGSTASIADNRKAGQRGGAAATAPKATATATTKKAGVPWWVFLLVGVGSVVGWEWLSSQTAVLKWLPWRVRPG